MGNQGLAAIRTHTSLGGQFEDLLADRQVGVIPSLGCSIARLLAPLPRSFLGVVLGIIQMIGAIPSRRGLGALAEEIRLELAFFPFELFDVLLQRGDPSQGIAMATLPICGLLAGFEVLSFEPLDFSAEVSDFLAQSRHRGKPCQGGVAGATDLYQLAIHDQPELPKRDRRDRGEFPQIGRNRHWRTQLRRSFTPNHT
jgi:hypothetical protein